MPVDYMQLLLDLMEERQNWVGKRDEAIREISRLSELVRATMNMVPPEQLARYEPVFERIEQRPAGLSMAIRACFTAAATGSGLFQFAKVTSPGRVEPLPQGVPITAAEGGWLTPIQIRDALRNMGFSFENYKANPLASIHTTLKRMVPAELEVKTLKDGAKIYRLKSAGEWKEAFAEVRQWLQNDLQVLQSAGSVIAVRKKNVGDKEK